jgi:hypothetical protein
MHIYRLVALTEEAKASLISELVKGAEIHVVGTEADLKSLI